MTGSESDAENLEQVLAILRANVDEDLLFQILRVSLTVAGERKDLLQRFVQERAGRLVEEKRVAYASAGDLVNALRARLEAEHRQKSAAAPSYALNNIQNLRRQQAAATASPGHLMDPGLVGFALLTLTVGFILTLLVWFLFLAPHEGERPAAPPVPGQAGEFDGTPRSLKGSITFVEPSGQGIMVRTSAGDTYYVVFRRSPGITFTKGAAFSGKVRPYKRDDRQVILAEFLSSP